MAALAVRRSHLAILVICYALLRRGATTDDLLTALTVVCGTGRQQGLSRARAKLRYEAVNKNYRQGHPDYNDLTVTVPTTGMPVNELLRIITQRVLGWQSTRFPSHLILYKEARDYTHGTVIWRQPSM